MCFGKCQVKNEKPEQTTHIHCRLKNLYLLQGSCTSNQDFEMHMSRSTAHKGNNHGEKKKWSNKYKNPEKKKWGLKMLIWPLNMAKK